MKIVLKIAQDLKEHPRSWSSLVSYLVSIKDIGSSTSMWTAQQLHEKDIPSFSSWNSCTDPPSWINLPPPPPTPRLISSPQMSAQQPLPNHSRKPLIWSSRKDTARHHPPFSPNRTCSRCRSTSFTSSVFDKRRSKEILVEVNTITVTVLHSHQARGTPEIHTVCREGRTQAVRVNSVDGLLRAEHAVHDQ